jgi:hypothetical protein
MLPLKALLSGRRSAVAHKHEFQSHDRASVITARRFSRPRRTASFAAEAGLYFQAGNALAVMHHLLVEDAEVASQLAAIALRFFFEASKRLDELVDLHFGTVCQPVNPLKPDRKGNTKRDRHAGTGADRNPTFGVHKSVAGRMKKPAFRRCVRQT